MHISLRVLRSNHFYLHSHRWFSNRAPCVLKHLVFELKGDSLKVPHFRFICGLTVGSINWVKVSYKQRASDLPLTDIKHFLSPHAVKRLIGQILTVAHTVKRLRSKYEKKKKKRLKVNDVPQSSVEPPWTRLHSWRSSAGATPSLIFSTGESAQTWWKSKKKKEKKIFC